MQASQWMYQRSPGSFTCCFKERKKKPPFSFITGAWTHKLERIGSRCIFKENSNYEGLAVREIMNFYFILYTFVYQFIRMQLWLQEHWLVPHCFGGKVACIRRLPLICFPIMSFSVPPFLPFLSMLSPTEKRRVREKKCVTFQHGFVFLIRRLRSQHVAWSKWGVTQSLREVCRLGGQIRSRSLHFSLQKRGSENS